MKQYLLAVHSVDGQSARADDDTQQAYKDVDALNSEMMASGSWVFAGGLEPPDTASVVRVSGSEILTTDGPFAETREQLGGFWVIQAADLDEALAWAAKATRACREPVEVRPFQGMPEA
ncbi:MAG TPA: YciI family protein [Streptosporangiaceae bacterium]